MGDLIGPNQFSKLSIVNTDSNILLLKTKINSLLNNIDNDVDKDVQLNKIKHELNDMERIIDQLITQKNNNFVPPEPRILNMPSLSGPHINDFKDILTSDHFNEGL